MTWTRAELDRLPVHNGFRLRGLEMTRLETFCDAAFAFAVTLLVISGDGIPRSYDELITALKGIPSFAASFAAVASLWREHRLWSRRFGLEDGWTTLISLGLVFVMLVYVYPLKMVFQAMFYWMSGGRLPSGFTIESARDMPGLFVVYGLGFATVIGLIGLLHVRSLKMRERLVLDDVEVLLTRKEIFAALVVGGTALASAAFAGLLPTRLGIWAGFAYVTLPITMPWLAVRYERKVRLLRRELDAAASS